MKPNPGQEMSGLPAGGRSVDVMFRLVDEEEWPPYPAELVPARMIGPGLAELTATPWFAEDVSRGDVVAVGRDGIGPVAESVACRGGRSTIWVVAGCPEDLADSAAALRALGAIVAESAFPPMLSVDVPSEVDLPAIEALLTDRQGPQLAFSVSCRQHAR